MKYRITDAPTNGTSGQDCGEFHYDELPARVRTAIAADPDATEWVLPALSDGDCGDAIADLQTVVTRSAT